MEDFSKLRLGKAENKLLVAARTLQPNEKPWLHLFANATKGMDTPLYLALVPSYASGERDSERRWSHTADILYISAYQMEHHPSHSAGLP